MQLEGLSRTAVSVPESVSGGSSSSDASGFQQVLGDSHSSLPVWSQSYAGSSPLPSDLGQELDEHQGTLLTSYAGAQTGQTLLIRTAGAQSQQQDWEGTHRSTTRITGTRGYWARENCFNHKHDVYSFGNVVLELITGQRHGDNARGSSQFHIPDYVVLKNL
ncbi:hypothetical protein KI387_012311 [Taxus chinensis]|uniref:Uncharacterized protein n=1 Tax=Taxus chinensis TaxID=29808 RepID=A0AA38FFT4_TAXCH|nr:hypothetical protein KI387_012311 [Taxus chinensis]